jgi:5-oxoprolinase (ATP-hydrolysing)/N-methylhydantoinase B
VEDCELVADSGGPGEFRGGLGYTRTLTVREVPITGSQCTDRHEIKPYPLSNVVFEPGDRIRLTTPGGGGYGDPKKRERERVEEDVKEGYVTAKAAAQFY